MPALIGILTAVAGMLLVLLLDIASQRYEAQQNQARNLELMAPIRARLENAVNASVFMTYGLAAHVAANPATSNAEFARLARQLLARNTHTRQLVLAPGNVISTLYPLQGSEQAVGLDLNSVPGQRDTVARGKVLQSMVIAGPIDLVQGGRALAMREPVYIGEGDARRYWGMVVALIDVDALFESAGLRDWDLPMRIAVRSREKGRPILHGPENLFERAAVIQIIQLPGTAWEIAGEPLEEYKAGLLQHGASRALGFMLALMAGGLMWRLQSQRVALRASEQKYRTLIEHLNDGICIVQDEVIRFINPRGESIVRYPSGQLLGMPIAELITNASERAHLVQHHRQRLQGMQGQDEHELRVRRGDGTSAHVRLNTAMVEWHGRAAALVAMTDITERVELETALRESRNRLAAMIQALPDSAFIVDQDGLYLDAFGGNASLYSTVEGVIGRTLQQCLPAELAETFLHCLRRVIQTGRMESIEYPLTAGDGSGTQPASYDGTQWFEARIAPLKAYPGEKPAVLWLAFNITAHKQTERELRLRESAIQALVENSPDVISRLDRNLRYIYINGAVERYTGIAPQAHIGRTSSEIGVDAATVSLWERHFRRALDEGVIQTFEFRMTSVHGQDLYFESRVIPEFGQNGAVETLLVLDREITERKRTEDQLRLAASVFHNTGEAMLVADAQRRVVRSNPAYARLTGTELDALAGKPCPYLHAALVPEALPEQRGSDSGSVHWQGEITAERADGECFPAWMTVNTVRNEQSEISHFLVSISDISSRKQWEQQLRHEATHDALTGLPNRTLLMDRLTVALALARRNNSQLAVLFLDLDNFKPINDKLGHSSGDRVLRELASRMRRTIRETDTVARIGGDEFVVVLPGPTDPHAIATVATTLLATLSKPIDLHGHICHVGASIGISRFPGDADDAEGLVVAADNAMYAAKGAGRGRYMLYDGACPPKHPDA